MSHTDIQPGTPAATVSSRRAVGLGAQVASYTGALLRAWVRDPGIIVQSLVVPAFMLAMFHLVFGESTTAIGLGDSIFGTTGLVALVGAMFGTAGWTRPPVRSEQTGFRGTGMVQVQNPRALAVKLDENAAPAPQTATTSLQVTLAPLANTARYDSLRAANPTEETGHDA